MIINPISINGNKCKDFYGCRMEDMSVMAGGYIITPRGEIISVRDCDEHRNIFSKYIHAYLEVDSNNIYDTLTATKMLSELGCCIYAGVRMEYIRNKLGNIENAMGSLTIPRKIEELTDSQRQICLHLIKNNTSIFGNKEKLTIQYGSFPDTVYTKEEITKLLENNIIFQNKRSQY